MRLSQATFLKSVSNLSFLPENSIVEIAFAGCSNSGKSSAINAITGIKNLAKSSKTPGRTQLINFFSICENKFLVDLPGYGYAKVTNSIKKNWGELLASYISTSNALKTIILTIDSRHWLKPLDLQMIEFCIYYQRQVHILLTKTDKLSKSQATQVLTKAQKDLAKYGDLISVQKFSVVTREGVEEVRNFAQNILE